MTKNQIDYRNSIENERHNKAVEAETNRANVVNTEVQKQYNAEVARHNNVSEQQTANYNAASIATQQAQIMQNTINRNNELAETVRHNAVMEAYQREVQKFNESVALANLELQRQIAAANYAISLEQNRIGAINANAATLQASVARQNAQTQAKNVNSQINQRAQQNAQGWLTTTHSGANSRANVSNAATNKMNAVTNRNTQYYIQPISNLVNGVFNVVGRAAQISMKK